MLIPYGQCELGRLVLVLLEHTRKYVVVYQIPVLDSLDLEVVKLGHYRNDWAPFVDSNENRSLLGSGSGNGVPVQLHHRTKITMDTALGQSDIHAVRYG